MRLLLSCLLCSVAFALSTWQVLGSGPLVRWDEDLGVALRHASPSTVPAEALSDIGNMAVALPLLAAAMALRLLAGRGRGWWPCCAVPWPWGRWPSSSRWSRCGRTVRVRWAGAATSLPGTRPPRRWLSAVPCCCFPACCPGRGASWHGWLRPC
ncbi:hypothetical protein ACWV95_27645 [Streptomyces albus]